MIKLAIARLLMAAIRASHMSGETERGDLDLDIIPISGLVSRCCPPSLVWIGNIASDVRVQQLSHRGHAAFTSPG